MSGCGAEINSVVAAPAHDAWAAGNAGEDHIAHHALRLSLAERLSSLADNELGTDNPGRSDDAWPEVVGGRR